MSEINEKLKDILATEGRKSIKDADVARELGITPNTYAQMKFRNSIPYKEIMDFLSRRKISINLFFYGTDPKETQDNSKRYKILRLYNSIASLGGGALNESISYKEIVIDKEIMGFFRSFACDIIFSKGDSMDETIQDGDLCVIDRQKAFREGKIYAINTISDGLIIKEARTKGDEIMTISHNSVYPPVFYKYFEAEIIGEVVGVIRRF